MPKNFLSPLRAAIYVLVLIFPVIPRTASAQERWQWPERAENLKVLPADTSTDDLRSTMFGFTRALGVRCVHCHVGEEGQPLSAFDFPSDDNPNKGRAREMMRMIGSIDEHLAKIEPSGPARVAVTCATCHHGRPRPQTLETVLDEAYRDGGADAAVARYRELREQFYGRGAYDFGAGTLVGFGFGLLAQDDADGALTMLRLNTEQYPDSAFAWATLAEAYLRTGKIEQAEVFFQKTLEVDPGNERAVEQLRKLRGGAEPAGETP